MKKNKKIRIVILLLIVSCVSWCIHLIQKAPLRNVEVLGHLEEKKDFYISQKNYSVAMKKSVEPFLNQYKKESILKTKDGTEIFYRSYILPHPKGTIVISHGFTEWIDKYNETIYYFLKEGYSVYIPCHRGHGLSTRTTEDLSLVHVEKFDNYVTDLAQLIEEIIRPQIGESPLVLFGHSMGGGIGTLLLENYPGMVDFAILSSPMLEINLGGMPNSLGYIITSVADLMGKGTHYIFTHGPFNPIPKFEASSTQAQERYMYMFEKKASNDYYHTEGGSFKWLKESLIATHKMTKQAHLVETPVLLFQVENDNLVKAGGQNLFAKRSKNTQLVFVPKAKHELYFEKDEIAFPYFDRIFEFLSEHK